MQQVLSAINLSAFMGSFKELDTHPVGLAWNCHGALSLHVEVCLSSKHLAALHNQVLVSVCLKFRKVHRRLPGRPADRLDARHPDL